LLARVGAAETGGGGRDGPETFSSVVGAISDGSVSRKCDNGGVGTELMDETLILRMPSRLRLTTFDRSRAGSARSLVFESVIGEWTRRYQDGIENGWKV
jgi:hypothetical protein